MDADGLPLVGPGIDYTKVEAIHQKRTLAFINHFITHTSKFMNRFSCVCEEKLENLSVKMQRLDITLNILESKLSSIPGLENVTAASSGQSSEASNATANATPQGQGPIAPQAQGPSAPEAPAAVVAAPEPVVDDTPKQTVMEDPRYSKFFKMLKMGVPPQAVKMKMSAEGLDPDLLDSPDAAIEPAVKGDSDDDFSDKDSSDSDEDSDGFDD